MPTPRDIRLLPAKNESRQTVASKETVMEPHAPEHPEEWVDADHSPIADDPWHDHAGEAAPQHAHGQTTPGAIAIVGLVSFLVLLFTMGAVAVYFFQVHRAEHVRKVERSPMDQEAIEARARWEAQLRGYEWVDAEQNVVSIPIDAAMRSVIRDYTSEASP